MTSNTPPEIEALAAILERGLRGSVAPEGILLFGHLLPLLAEGRPVSPQRIANVLGQPRDEVLAALRRLPSLEWDAAGNVVGAGLTLRPTPHHFCLTGQTLFTWCALDALMYPALIGTSVRVESPCAATGTPVQVIVTPDGVEQVKPAEAVVSVVTPEASPDVRRMFCDHVNFFRSAEAAAAWLAQHPGATTLPVAEAYQLGRRLAASIYGPDPNPRV